MVKSMREIHIPYKYICELLNARRYFCTVPKKSLANQKRLRYNRSSLNKE